MRRIFVLATVVLASCSGGQTANNEAVAEESSGSELTAANDTTAIDAATGEAADMAADVDYSFNETTGNQTARNGAEDESSTTTRRRESAPDPDEPAASDAEADASDTNSL